MPPRNQQPPSRILVLGGTGRMTAGMPPAPMAGLSVAFRLVPRPAWRRVSR